MGPPALSDILKVMTLSFAIYNEADRRQVTQKEAAKFIETFLGKFPGVAKFLESAIEYAKQNGHVRTLVGRRRLLPGKSSSKTFSNNVSLNLLINFVWKPHIL